MTKRILSKGRSSMQLKSFLSLFSILVASGSLAQTRVKLPAEKVTILDSDFVIHAQVSKPRKVHLINTVYYYSTRGGHLYVIRGGYEGKLLDGTFEELYPKKTLKTKGMLTFGLKNGLWKSWNENGWYQDLVTWRNGSKNGPFKLYDAEGKLLRMGNYKKDLLNGEIQDARPLTAAKDTFSTSYYKNGVVVGKNDESFFERYFKWLRFKRKVTR